MSKQMQMEFKFELASSVPETAKQEKEACGPSSWKWVEASVWTERMLAALGNGVKGGKNAFFAERGLFTMYIRPTFWRANPDEETTDWRAVCGRTACTVRRAGRELIPSRPLSCSYRYTPQPRFKTDSSRKKEPKTKTGWHIRTILY